MRVRHSTLVQQRSFDCKSQCNFSSRTITFLCLLITQSSDLVQLSHFKKINQIFSSGLKWNEKKKNNDHLVRVTETYQPKCNLNVFKHFEKYINLQGFDNLQLMRTPFFLKLILYKTLQKLPIILKMSQEKLLLELEAWTYV